MLLTGLTRSGYYVQGVKCPNIQATPQETRSEGSWFVRCQFEQRPQVLAYDRKSEIQILDSFQTRLAGKALPAPATGSRGPRRAALCRGLGRCTGTEARASARAPRTMPRGGARPSLGRRRRAWGRGATARSALPVSRLPRPGAGRTPRRRRIRRNPPPPPRAPARSARRGAPLSPPAGGWQAFGGVG